MQKKKSHTTTSSFLFYSKIHNYFTKNQVVKHVVIFLFFFEIQLKKFKRVYTVYIVVFATPHHYHYTLKYN